MSATAKPASFASGHARPPAAFLKVSRSLSPSDLIDSKTGPRACTSLRLQ